MKKLTMSQMDELQGGGLASCMSSVGLGFLGYAGMYALTTGSVGVGAALLAVGVLTGCLF